MYKAGESWTHEKKICEQPHISHGFYIVKKGIYMYR